MKKAAPANPEAVDQSPPGWTEERIEHLTKTLGVSNNQLQALVDNLSLQATTAPSATVSKADRQDLVGGVVKGFEHALKVLKPIIEAHRESEKQSAQIVELV